MGEPAISIIVPVYNSEPYIRKCLDSILSQTYTNFELIIVNDGSPDQSGMIINEYAKKDERIRVLNKENGGVCSARNAGINIATGKYIGFVDADDWIYEDMFQTLVELCEDTKSDISVCCLYREVDNHVIAYEREPFIKEMDNLEAMKELFSGRLFRFAVWAKLYKKSCFKNIKYPEDRMLDDLPTTYKVFANAHKVVFTSYTGYIYVKRENSILTSKYNEKKLDVFLGWDEIITFMNDKYPQLSDEYISCFVYYSLDHVYKIINSVKDTNHKDKYILYIQQFVRKYYKDILKNRRLSFKYKYLMSLLNYNVNFMYFNNNLNRKIRH